MNNFKVLKHRIPIVPKFYWHVSGNKRFDFKYSPAIRANRKIGIYGVRS